MNLESVTIAIRPRRDWEAVDLGILMARHWWSQLFRVWLLVALPFFLPLLVLPLEYMGWYLFFIWLCKPLFERPLLHILSQGVFGQTPSIKDTLRATPKLLLPQLIQSLTWRRLSPSRSMNMPVSQLEGLRGSERSARINILHRQDSAPAKWLTMIGVHLETFLGIAIIAFLGMLIPEEVSMTLFDEALWETRTGTLLWAAVYYLSMACIAPFYVACGFSLYLNRRVKLEGWDLEIAFKRMVQQRGLASSVIPWVFACTLGLMTYSPPSVADDAPQEPDRHELAQLESENHALEEREALRNELVEILGKEPFRNKKTIKVRKIEETDEDESSESDVDFGWLGDLFRGLGRLLDGIAAYFEILLWALVIGLVLFVVLRFKRWQTFFAERGFLRKDNFRPTTLFGMEVTEESLPDNISESALQLWQQGDHRGALALLYRASLARLLANGVPLRDGSTEQECLHIVHAQAKKQQVPNDVANYFDQLTTLWRRLAYGHLEPPAEQAQQLCQSWNSHWLGGNHDA